MARIRRLVEADLPAVVALHNRLFGNWKHLPLAEAQAYFAQLFFHHPWQDHTLASLVYEDDDGRILGCLGAMRRSMVMNGQPIQVAVSHNYMVDSDRRATLAGIMLMRAFFEGSQDLSLAEGNDLSRRVWEGLGGTTATPYRFVWTCLLRPAQHVASLLAEHGLPAFLAAALRPFCRLADWLAGRFPKSPFRARPPKLVGRELDDKTVVSRFAEFTRARTLKPVYDEDSWRWLMEFLGQRKALGTLRKIGVHRPALDGAGDDLVGWYVYAARPGGRGHVLQLAARDDAQADVLDHLLHDAREQGVVVLSGQVEPRLLDALAARPFIFKPNQTTILIHSRSRELIDAIQSGQAFLSRLDGEWWIGR